MVDVVEGHSIFWVATDWKRHPPAAPSSLVLLVVVGLGHLVTGHSRKCSDEIPQTNLCTMTFKFCEIRDYINGALYVLVGHTEEPYRRTVIISRVGMFSAVFSHALEFPFHPCVRRRVGIRRGILDLAASKRYRVLCWSRLGADGARR